MNFWYVKVLKIGKYRSNNPALETTKYLEIKIYRVYIHMGKNLFKLRISLQIRFRERRREKQRRNDKISPFKRRNSQQTIQQNVGTPQRNRKVRLSADLYFLSRIIRLC
jgi:hypothetical protein